MKINKVTKMKSSFQIIGYRPRNLLNESKRFMTWFDFVVVSSNSFRSSTFSNLNFCSRVELERDFKFEFEFEKSKFAHL